MPTRYEYRGDISEELEAGIKPSDPIPEDEKLKTGPFADFINHKNFELSEDIDNREKKIDSSIETLNYVLRRCPIITSLEREAIKRLHLTEYHMDSIANGYYDETLYTIDYVDEGGAYKTVYVLDKYGARSGVKIGDREIRGHSTRVAGLDSSGEIVEYCSGDGYKGDWEKSDLSGQKKLTGLPDLYEYELGFMHQDKVLVTERSLIETN